MERKGMPEPEIVKKFKKQAEEQMSTLQQLEAEETQLKSMKLQARQELEAEVYKEAARQRGLDPDMVVPMQPEEAGEVVERDIDLARSNL